jgi:hypothetical protein
MPTSAVTLTGGNRKRREPGPNQGRARADHFAELEA